MLARHVAHLFVRDPLVIYHGSVEEVDDSKSSEHFEVSSTRTLGESVQRVDACR